MFDLRRLQWPPFWKDDGAVLLKALDNLVNNDVEKIILTFADIHISAILGMASGLLFFSIRN